MSIISTRPGLSLFEVPPRSTDPAHTFATLFENAQRVEQLGFETYWLAEGHFSAIGSPSALTLLAAVTQRTTRLRLGTAVVPLALDNPLRIAETASLVNTLGGDRIELGVGKGNPGGFSTAAYHAFGLDETERETLYADTLDRLRAAFAHTEIGTDGREYDLYPPADALPRRVWQATANVQTARAIGAAGDGLHLHRAVPGGDTGRAQKPLVEAYLSTLDPASAPRIGVSRSILPARDEAEAIRLFAGHLADAPHTLPGLDTSGDPADVLRSSSILFGSPAQIVEGLLADPTVRSSTDYLFSIPLGHDRSEYRESLAWIAEEIHPHLP
ncbi:LLM class flavin-dependent oxidoreductase, partial [Microbacterium sp.]|uniref:LLM class flavin-dependent oxidoreductase n=1 Tax=Microbacterium sp. TaxID=51671 RepID=UPI00289F9778